MIQGIKSGITPKGTIFIRAYNEANQLINKRVLKNGIQYDAKINTGKTRKCSQVLITDWKNNGEQSLQLMAKPVGLVKRILSKLGIKQEDAFVGTKGKLMEHRKPISLEINNDCDDILFESYVTMVQDKTGYSSELLFYETNRLAERLK